VRYNTIRVNELDVFYREAGSQNAPVILLLHGFPTSSNMFRYLKFRKPDQNGVADHTLVDPTTWTLDHLPARGCDPLLATGCSSQEKMPKLQQP
jgi:pimeloyl-ACP methyl ester carboxylesterase